jgi:hypothetical protein
MGVVQMCRKICVLDLSERICYLAIGLGEALPCLGLAEKAVRAHQFVVVVVFFFFFLFLVVGFVPCGPAIGV